MANNSSTGNSIGSALADAESMEGGVSPNANVAAEICAAVNAVDADMASLAFSELPKEDNYESDEEEEEKGGAKKKRSWLGKMSKRLFKGWRPKSSDDETKKLIMACRAPTASSIGGFAIQDPEHARLCRSVLTLMVRICYFQRTSQFCTYNCDLQVRQMGKNLLKGANVMNVSFPIQCCQPRTVMEIAATQGGSENLYLNRFSPQPLDALTMPPQVLAPLSPPRSCDPRSCGALEAGRVLLHCRHGLYLGQLP
jgi:hypothetical protein